MLEGILALLALTVILAALWRIGRRKWRRVQAETERMPDDWPEYEMDRRAYGEQMRIALMISDARFILRYQYAGRSASRRAMLKRGISERRWRHAVMLMRQLHIYERDGHVPVVSERLAEMRLERHQRIHAARITRSPAAYVAP